MKRLQIFFLIILFLAFTSVGSALAITNEPINVASGARVIHPEVVPIVNCKGCSTGAGFVKVTGASILLQTRGEGIEGFLSFNAQSEARECNLSGDRSAWLNIQLVGKDGTTIGTDNPVWIASIPTRGGTMVHNDIGIHAGCLGKCGATRWNNGLLKEAYGFKMHMPGKVRC